MKIRRHERRSVGDEELVEVLVPLDPKDWHGMGAEALWAERVEQGYLLRSTPFHAFDLAAEDVVEADADLRFVKVLSRGGGSNYRLLVEGGAARVAERLEALEELEVSCEIDGELVALDVPPQADLDEVYALLADGEEDGAWTFEEGHVGA